MASRKPKPKPKPQSPQPQSPKPSWKPRLRGSAAELKARAAQDAQERRDAGKHPKSIILNAKDVQGGYDASRVLMTTMGGKARVLTYDDLATFRHNVRKVQKNYSGGILARQVLDLSRPEDRKHANDEIHMAIPVYATAGTVRFMTNAGPDSNVVNHHVLVNFMSYASAASGARGTSRQSANWLRKQPLKIECDCGRWRYWYRYIATIGKYNAGRDETGYPKIRNLELFGIACKHLIRVMAEVEASGAVLNFLIRLIDKARSKDDNKVNLQTTQQEANQITSTRRRIRNVETTMRQRQRALERAALARAAPKAQPPKKVAAATRKIESLIKSGAVTQNEVNKLRRMKFTDANVLKIIQTLRTT
jgi:hypothetical protein